MSAQTSYIKIMIKLEYYCDNARHLVCLPYTQENLHKMAQDLNIKRCWFHNRGARGGNHYDIPKRRISEIQSKCHVVTGRIILKIMKEEITSPDEVKLDNGITISRTSSETLAEKK